MKYEDIKTREDLMKLYDLIKKLKEEISINDMIGIKTDNDLELKLKNYEVMVADLQDKVWNVHRH